MGKLFVKLALVSAVLAEFVKVMVSVRVPPPCTNVLLNAIVPVTAAQAGCAASNMRPMTQRPGRVTGLSSLSFLSTVGWIMRSVSTWFVLYGFVAARPRIRGTGQA